MQHAASIDGGWQADVAGHIVGVAGEAGGWGGEKWLGGAGGDGRGRWRVGGEDWRGSGGREGQGGAGGQVKFKRRDSSFNRSERRCESPERHSYVI